MARGGVTPHPADRLGEKHGVRHAEMNAGILIEAVRPLRHPVKRRLGTQGHDQAGPELADLPDWRGM